jgi:hypothetical protein
MSGLHSEWTPGFKPPHALARAGARLRMLTAPAKKNVGLFEFDARRRHQPAAKKGGLRHVPLGRLEG